MYSAFSEAIRRTLFFVSRTSLSLAENGFKYLTSYYSEENRCLMVKYVFNGQELDEVCDKFIRSPYVKTLSSKQLNDIINQTADIKAKNKIYTISLFDETPDIFIIKNNVTNLSEERLLSDIISDRKLLEKADADSLRLLINSAINLASSGYSIISTSYNPQTTGGKKDNINKILHFPSKKIKNVE